MRKLKRILFFILVFILLIPVNSYASASYTTDDLRVLMGMHRLSEDGSMLEIKRLLSTCYKEKEWNELVSHLGEVGDEKIKEFKEKEDAWYNAKDILESNFVSNKPIKTILNNYVEYQTAASLRGVESNESYSDLSLIDDENIEAKIAYANSLLEAADDSTDIGIIGYKMKPFTKAGLLISIPFGSSYSIDSGKQQYNKGLTIAIKQKNKIYSQFNGIVTAVTDNSVTVRSGKSIEIEYLGIRPSVVKKQIVKQYNTIGKTKTKSITIKFKLNTVYADPLLLYGSRSGKWYEQWENSNPGCIIEKRDYSELRDSITADITAGITKKAPDFKAGTITDKAGKTEQITIQGDNNYTDTADNIVIEKAPSESIDKENK